MPTLELESSHDEWLIMKLCMYVVCIYAGWSDTLSIIPLKIDTVDNIVFRINNLGAF